jgi:hypothetical protein
METNRHPIIPNHYFSYVSSECQLLFKDRHYYGCIALCQSVAEALARFMYEKWTSNRPAKQFEANIHKIRNADVQPDVSNLLENIYGGRQRHDFHHLNKTVSTEYEKLRSIATDKIDLLNRVEVQVFEYEITERGLKVKYPKYWESTNGFYNTFLRICP